MQDSKNNLIKIPQINEQLAKIINEPSLRTPQEFIKRRPDGFNYVEIGYVKLRLNQLFTPLGWNYATTEIGTIADWLKIGQITVKVELKIRLPYNEGWMEIIKTGYGGVKIQKLRATGEIMDLGNDLKSAEADGLKKAASNFGIAFDIFHSKVVKDVKMAKIRTSAVSAMPNNDEISTVVQINNDTKKNYYLRGIFAMAKGLWNLTDKEEIKQKIIQEIATENEPIPYFSFRKAKEEFLRDIFDKMQILQSIPK